ncbi:MAG: peptidoglycan-associated lipoprotein Pal [Gammaproteobacteria bacterium]|nr:peptidoglycan-associated lipoprotein Pal [Gammaproteobacteria bacterium]
MTIFRMTMAAALALQLLACASQEIPDPDPLDSGMSDSSATTDEFDERDLGAGEEIPSDVDFYADGDLIMTIYFDFDQSEIRPDDQATLEQHANRLANDSGARVRLEGHADERGSREYNIGLGERRAQSVRRLLLIQGASAAQISTVSFGEERPAAFGSDEDSWALNRRVEIKYLN